jgi:ankyrin repeat protein
MAKKNDPIPEHPMIVFARMARESMQNDPQLSKLTAAAQRGDVPEVKRLLAKGLDPNKLPPGGTDTAVWAAVYGRKPDVIRVLGEAGADLNAGYPETPLETAGGWGHVELVRALIAGGADVNRPNTSGQTPLRSAVAKGHVDVAVDLLKGGADPTFAPKCDRYPEDTSPLEWAAYVSGPPILDAMLPALAGKTIEKLDALLLCGASMRGNVAEVKRRVEAGGDVNDYDKSGRTPLHCAALNGKADVVKYLLAAGADPNGGDSPLEAGASSGKLKIVQMLIAAGANDLDNALMSAKQARQKKVVDYLLKVRDEGPAAKKSKSKAVADRPTGVPTFNVNDSCILIETPVEKVAAAFAKLIGADIWKENVLGQKVKLTGRCFAVYRIVGQPWSIIMWLNCDPLNPFHKTADAQSLSKSLKTRAMIVISADTSGIAQYITLDKGKPVELFDSGSVPSGSDRKAAAELVRKSCGADFTDFKNVEIAGGNVFASSLRKVKLSSVKNPLDFINDHLRNEKAFAPFAFESWGSTGQSVELTLEGLGPDDIERLDYVALSD